MRDARAEGKQCGEGNRQQATGTQDRAAGNSTVLLPYYSIIVYLEYFVVLVVCNDFFFVEAAPWHRGIPARNGHFVELRTIRLKILLSAVTACLPALHPRRASSPA